MAEREQVTTDTAGTGSPWVWVYRALALTGIAVGIFIIAAGLWLLFAPQSWYNARTHSCASMEADMKQMMADMKNQMKGMQGGMQNTPGMGPMPNMPSTSPMPNMPSTSPMPNMPMPSH